VPSPPQVSRASDSASPSRGQFITVMGGRKCFCSVEPATLNLPHPCLLPKEKENCPPSLWKCARLDLPDNFPPTKNHSPRCPLRGGEETGEGGRPNEIRPVHPSH
jgi:hypothetical protein